MYGRAGRDVYMLPKVRGAKEAISWEARSQYRGAPLTGPLKVDVQIYWPDKRKHDVDNIKALLDSLAGVVWEDDGQICDLRIIKAYDKANPTVELQVDDLR